MLQNGVVTELNRWFAQIGLIFLLLLQPPSAVIAAEAAQRDFDLAAGDAAATLKQFALQANREIMFPVEPVAGVKTNAVKGSFSGRDALDRMVADTGLVVVEDAKTGALMVLRAASLTRVAASPPPNSESQVSQPPRKDMKTMNRKTPIAVLSSLLGFAFGSHNLSAQAANTTPATPQKEEIVELSPFEVTASNRGYYAPNTMSGTRINTKLEDLAASISVVTKEQMADFAMLDMNDIFLYEASTEGNQTYTDFDFDRNGYPTDNTSLEPNFANRIRGINAANNARGNFETSGRVPLDPINIDAVEISRGPNANIFGLGNSSGTVNQVPSSANLSRDLSQVQFRGDSSDGYRSSVDLSRVIKKDTLAIRGSAAYQHTGYERKPSGTDTVRLNGMVKFRPFKNTTLSAAFESYRIHGNTPNQTTPRETRALWKAQGMPTFNNKSKQVRINGVLVPAVQSISTVTPFGLFNTTGSGRTNSLVLVDKDGTVTFWGQPEGTVTLTPVGNPGARNQANVGFQVNTNSTVDLLPGFSFPIPEVASLYGDPAVTDQSFYDWTKHNLAAMNYLSESTKTTHVGLEQIFFNTPRQMLALQLGYYEEDSKKYRRDLAGAPTSQRTVGALYIDANEFLPDGSPNPNLLRPYVGLWIPNSYENPLLRRTSRAQLAYRLDLKKEKNLWRWLGMHQLSGYAEYKDNQTRRLNYKDSMTSNNSFLTAGAQRATTAGAVTNNYYRFYVGDNVGQNVDYGPHSFKRGDYPYRWGTVEALGPTGVVTTPANIRTENATLGPAVTSGGGNSNNRNILKTTGAVLQSYLLTDRVITTFGVRKDRSYNRAGRSNVFLPDGSNIDMDRFNQWADGDWNFGEGETRTAGVVVRPLRWLSIYANKSDSFRPASPAITLFLQSLPDPTGKGNDYGFSVNLFDGKLVARFNQYENTQINARDGQAGTIGGRANQMDFNSSNIASTPFALAVQAQGWTRRAHPTWTNDQVFAEVLRITKLDAAYFDQSDLSFNGNLAEAADVLGKGQELEINYNPSNFWTMRLNLTRQETINGKMFSDIQDYINFRMPTWQGIVDPETRTPWWTTDYDPSTTTRTPQLFYTGSVLQPLKLLQASQGKSRPSIRKYNWRVSTNYNLAGLTEHRILKNFRVGGALRWEDKGSIGFKLRDPQAILADPNLSYLDPDRPIWDKAHLFVDANVTYRTRLFANKVGATFQLNVRNLLENGRLQPVKANPDGAPIAYRIVDPQQFILSATFDL
ncbi:MAG: TonB-dependent receptor [Verrucomicrobia bacterium]|nr:TonB-dependent receptor [Verrucomicrobiota bacterium]